MPIITQQSNSPATGSKLENGSQVNESVRAVIYSPADQATARMKILGDPDYIMTVVGVNQNIGEGANNSAKAIYGPDNSINPFGGQVFIQIMFNMTTDYQNNGVMDISDKIQFYDTNLVSDSGIKGIVYQVRELESYFNKGSFTQVLELNLVLKKQLLDLPDDESSTSNSSGTGTGTGTGESNRPTSGDPTIKSQGDIRAFETRQTENKSAQEAMSNPYSGLSDSNSTSGSAPTTSVSNTTPASAKDDQNLPRVTSSLDGLQNPSSASQREDPAAAEARYMAQVEREMAETDPNWKLRGGK